MSKKILCSIACLCALMMLAWQAQAESQRTVPVGMQENAPAQSDATGSNAQDPNKADNTRSAENQENSDKDGKSGGEMVTLPENSTISVRIADEINSSHNHTGDLFTGIVDPSVMVHDRVVIPRGTEAHVRMAEDKKGGHVHGKAEVKLELVSLVVNGKRLEVESETANKKKGTVAAKGKAEAKAGASGDVMGGPTAMAGPVIAAFSAAKVEIKPNTRVEFTLASPFTFAKPEISNNEQPR